jgi:AraC family transcriptional regulator of adaptative response / DNA-3-methyladenine glycosylase II
MKRDDTYYKAMLARDHRFDGKFFVGVKTTGIYCRPICPAKPKRENVEFFKSQLEAEKSGYRPCLRCRPEVAPLSPAWLGKSAVIQRAVRVLYQLEEELVDEKFANLFGMSTRHLRRLFKNEIGKTPKQLFSEKKLNLARSLIVETNLPLSEVAFASGFKSIRRFNDAFKIRFTKTPSQIRRHPLSSDKVITVALPYRPPFDFHGLLQSYKTHQVGNLEHFSDGEMVRVIAFNEKIGKIRIKDDDKSSRLLLEIDFPDLTVIPRIIARTRAMFDLDSDPALIANSLELTPRSKSLLKRNLGIRLPSGWDPFETAISIILGQLVSTKMARRLVHDLVDSLGDDSGLRIEGKVVKLFPAPKAIAESDLQFLKTTRKRRETVISFSRIIFQGNLSLETTQDVDEFIKKVITVPGIGNWTAQFMALKVLRHTDAFPSTDLALARALKDYDQVEIKKMQPWRGYFAALVLKEYMRGVQS